MRKGYWEALCRVDYALTGREGFQRSQQKFLLLLAFKEEQQQAIRQRATRRKTGSKALSLFMGLLVRIWRK
jgi:hypothetical protein